jgi:SAM-dependent methyltransferase
MNWAREALRLGAGWDELKAIHHALRAGSGNAEGLPVPHFLRRAFDALPARASEIEIQNYIAQFLDQPQNGPDPCLDEHLLYLFGNVWNRLLASESPTPVSVVELACGSANDYRFFDTFGLAKHLDYTGLDLCEKNIRNAQAMFPRARFAVGNALSISAADLSFEYCLVQDLFEHLSIEALECALAETCRITRKGLCFGFFNAHEGEDHIVRPVESYHWNALSLRRIRQQLEHHGFQVQAVHIDTFLRWRFGCGDTHNQNAYTCFAERR